MGFGVPAAIGAKIANPDKDVVLFVGDGGFQMTNQELAILNIYKIPIKVIMLNNHSLGMVRQWQEAFYDCLLYTSKVHDGINSDCFRGDDTWEICCVDNF